MSMNITNNYSQFYKGTEPIKQYGSGIGTQKDTLVKYEFNTIDADGRKVMDQDVNGQFDREETLRVMKDISSQYGDNVIVEFSGDGMAKLVESRKGNLDFMEEDSAKSARQSAFDSQVVQMENTHRMVIPNIQTNEKLYHSLSNADEKIVSAAMTPDRICSYLIVLDENGEIAHYRASSGGGFSGPTEEEQRQFLEERKEEAKKAAEYRAMLEESALKRSARWQEIYAEHYQQKIYDKVLENYEKEILM